MASNDPGQRHPVLVCTGGGIKGKRFTIGERGLLLGRSPGCEVQLDDQGVSREHARVILHNDAVWVQDAGSRNGCFVNGRRLVRHKQLAPGDELKLGEHTFTVELVDLFPDHESVSTFGVVPEGLRTVPDAPPKTGRPAVVVGLIVAILAVAAVAAALLASG